MAPEFFTVVVAIAAAVLATAAAVSAKPDAVTAKEKRRWLIAASAGVAVLVAIAVVAAAS